MTRTIRVQEFWFSFFDEEGKEIHRRMIRFPSHINWTIEELDREVGLVLLKKQNENQTRVN